ncbi:MAG TPA: tetratricopeptide repeat protein [Candidatus Polarisedimenticolaceae bacterium]|nr:tetratricopeptide repeat protein [Candidatus Polarisedimenticolaceae bacterium]
MAILSAENSFRKGLVALVEGDPAAATTHFQSAILIERQHGVARPQMRYLSYYGLTLAQSRGANPESIQACETASRRDFFNPDLLLNLGRVYLLAGKTTKALATFERGLAIAPGHKALRAEHAKVDRRSPPPLSMLSRTHPLNKLLGKTLAALRSHTPRWIGGSRATTSL